MAETLEYFTSSLSQVLSEYAKHRFILERDFVWTVQKRVLEDLEAANNNYTVFNDFPVEKGKLNRGISADLAILRKGITREKVLEGKERVELAVEFKFEPSPKRDDICGFKLPVVFWPAIEKDIERVRRFTESKKAKTGIAIFIDEFGRYKDEKSTQLVLTASGRVWAILGQIPLMFGCFGLYSQRRQNNNGT